jgi:transposase-like protein
MSRKRHTPEEIVTKLRQVEVLTAQGRPVAEAIRSIGVTEVTYYRWRNEYGGLKGDQVKRLKELEAENARLRRAVSDLTLEKLILKEAASGAAGERSLTGEPRPPPRLCRARGRRTRRLRAHGLPCAWPTSLDALSFLTAVRMSVKHSV